MNSKYKYLHYCVLNDYDFNFFESKYFSSSLLYEVMLYLMSGNQCWQPLLLTWQIHFCPLPFVSMIIGSLSLLWRLYIRLADPLHSTRLGHLPLSVVRHLRASPCLAPPRPTSPRPAPPARRPPWRPTRPWGWMDVAAGNYAVIGWRCWRCRMDGWLTGWIGWIVDGHRALGPRQWKTMKTAIWFIAMAMSCKTDVREYQHTPKVAVILG